MLVFFQGRFVPEAEAKVSIFDRSLLYGDGLFETVPVLGGRPFRWRQHLDRFQRGARFLKIAPPFSGQELARHTAELIQRTGLDSALLRITLSRGVGPRGYSASGAKKPWLALSLHPAPPLRRRTPCGWKLVTSKLRLASNDALACHKTANKLRQVLAQAEAEAQGAEQALLLNEDGAIAEASAANVFWIEHGAVCTPPLSDGALPGVTRAVVREICHNLKLPHSERRCVSEALLNASGVFLSLSSEGIAEAVFLDGRPLARSPVSIRLFRAYQELLVQETRSAPLSPLPHAGE